MEQVYVKFGINDTYFEVEVESLDNISTEMVDKQPVLRKKWGEVIIRNKPYLYTTDPTTKNKLYTEITSKPPTQYMFIKHVGNGTDITEGYLGVIDCEIDDAKKFIKVTPQTYDQYTQVLEHMNTKVNIFDKQNIILNGKFDTWVNSLPFNWKYVDDLTTDNSPERLFILNSNTAKLKARGYYNVTGWGEDGIEGLTLAQYIDTYGASNINKITTQTTIFQDERQVEAVNQVYVSFYYQLMELWNEIPIRSQIEIQIRITTDSGVLYAKDDGSWTSVNSRITVSDNALPYPFSEINSFRWFSRVFDTPPSSGLLSIAFIHVVPENASLDLEDASDLNKYAKNEYENSGWTYYESDLLITNVVIEASSMQYISVDVSLPSSDIVSKQTDGIQNESGNNFALVHNANVRRGFVLNYENENSEDFYKYYFDVETNAPNTTKMSDPTTGFFAPSSTGVDWSVDGYIELFKSANSGFFLGELSSVVIYEGERWNYVFPSLTRSLQLKAGFIFSREEFISEAAYTQDDYLAGRCDLSQVWDGISEKQADNYREPEYDVGWNRTVANPRLGGMIWVRTPFNGAATDWEISELGGGVVDGIKYTKKIICNKIYPIGADSKIYSNTVNFKDVVKKVFNNTHPELKGKEVFSTFLWNDFPDDAKTAKLLDSFPLLNSNRSINYYTRSENYLKNISCLHTYELKTVKTIGDGDSEIEMSLRELIDDIKVIFPFLYWFMDEDWNLHLEHESYEDYINDIVISREQNSDYQVWKYNKNEMFAISDFNMVNSGYKDFAFAVMEFEKIVSNRRSTDIRDSKTAKTITTDIQFCIENSDDLSNGLILVNYNPLNNNKIVTSVGDVSKTERPNANLALANMLQVFGNFEGTWEKGKINNRDRVFKHTKRTKEGLETIELKGIVHENHFLTDVGLGFPRTKTFDYRKNVTLLELLYRYKDWLLTTETDKTISI